jgi:uncharacterized repeat protein (TIGR03806 family)
MNKKYFLYGILVLVIVSLIAACGSDNADDGYTEVPEEYSPVVADLAAVPYATLSEYKLFEGDMKNLSPAKKVLPYDLNSSLFTDYAKKKRFVWMPEGTKATYNTDGSVLDFPTGTLLIKNFYYDGQQMQGAARIMETRMMIKKSDGWIFANYIWNDDQTEAVLNTNGANIDIAWNENGVAMNTTYAIPSESACAKCHTLNSKKTTIGPKPQNLNKLFAYASGSKNQLSKWIEEGYLDTAPSAIVSTVDWADASQPADLRARSYFDINCAHCHNPNSSYMLIPLKFAFAETANPANMGMCVAPVDPMPGQNFRYVISRQNAEGSLLYFKMSSNDPDHRMPILGRTVVHAEAVSFMEEWINNMETSCK